MYAYLENIETTMNKDTQQGMGLRKKLESLSGRQVLRACLYWGVVVIFVTLPFTMILIGTAFAEHPIVSCICLVAIVAWLAKYV